MLQNTMDQTASNVSITQQVYESLRSQIVVGELSPGVRLKVEDLKQRLGTGASPIREALSLLTSDQLVERIDQRGFRVANVSATQFQEILKLRCTLEDMALRESLLQASAEWEDRLVRAHDQLLQADREQIAEFEHLHKEFHMALLSGCDSPILLGLCDRLYDLNIRYRYLAGRTTEYRARDVSQEHAQILQAALDRDADFAALYLIRHYRKTGQYLDDRLSGLGLTA